MSSKTEYPIQTYYVASIQHREGMHTYGEAAATPELAVEAYGYRRVCHPGERLAIYRYDYERTVPDSCTATRGQPRHSYRQTLTAIIDDPRCAGAAERRATR